MAGIVKGEGKPVEAESMFGWEGGGKKSGTGLRMTCPNSEELMSLTMIAHDR